MAVVGPAAFILALEGTMGLADTYFHIGILVPDMARAIENYGEVLGMEFHAPSAVPLDTWEQPGATETASEITIAFSKAGPPYYELIEAAGSALFRLSQGGGVHHVGVWMDDPDVTLAKLKRAGIPVAATNRTPTGEILTIFTSSNAFSGVRIEYVNTQFRAAVEHFLATGKFPEAGA